MTRRAFNTNTWAHLHTHPCTYTVAHMHNICAQAFYTQTTMPIVTGTEAQAQMHGWKYVRIYMERHKIEMCIRRSLYFDNFQNKKNLKNNNFVSISFRNLVRSIHPTTCRSMFSEANACARIAGSGENCCELAGSLLYTSEKSRAVWKKCRVCQKAMSFPSPLTKMWKTNGTGSGFRRWMRTEYRFNTDVESLISRGLQLKITN